MMNKNLIQAYQQAPWRKQLQYFGLFLLGLVIVALIAGVYLYISAETVSEGVGIQDLESSKTTIKREIAGLESQLADLEASDKMQQRAKDLKYEPIDPNAVVYMKIPGYPGRQTVLLGPPPANEPVPQPIIKPIYTQSLWEWFNEGLMGMNDYPMGSIK